MNTLASRLKAERIAQGYEDQGALAIAITRKTGVTVRQQNIQQVESGKVERPRYLNELAKTLGVFSDWLLTGDEPKYLPAIMGGNQGSPKDAADNPLNFAVRDQLSGYDAFNSSQSVTGSTESPFGIGVNSNVTETKPLQGRYPVISDVQAGAWDEAYDEFEPGQADDWVTTDKKCSPRTFGLRVSGDSMTTPYGQSFPDGCKIVVDPEQRGGIVSGDKVVAKINGEDGVTFKQFIEESGKRFLKPLNPQYPIITDEFRILGKVIQKIEDV